MVKTWDEHTEEERGELIKLYFNNPTLAKVNSDIELLDTSREPFASRGGVSKFGENYTAAEYPDRASVYKFKDIVLVRYRDYLDGVGLGFKRNITASQIALLVISPALEVDKQSGARFVSKVGITPGNDSRETGIENRMFIRDKTEQAILKPDDYIKELNADLERIDLETLQTYRDSFKNYYEKYKFSAEEAKAMAMRDKESHYNRLLEAHNKVYKSEYLKSAKKRIVKQLK